MQALHSCQRIEVVFISQKVGSRQGGFHIRIKLRNSQVQPPFLSQPELTSHLVPRFSNRDEPKRAQTLARATEVLPRIEASTLPPVTGTKLLLIPIIHTRQLSAGLLVI
jgi:hypothetical protein